METPTRLLEEITANAWPAPQMLVYDGWLIRFAAGYSRRANSVIPLYASSQDLSEKIERCERLYACKGLPAIFKVTPASQPLGLDNALAQRGYSSQARTGLWLTDLPIAPAEPDADVVLTTGLRADWFESYWQMSGNAPRHADVARRILGNIAADTCYASLKVDGVTAAVGLAVAQAGFVGLFDIVTAAEYRRRGLGRRVVQTLLAWGRQSGAHTGYLQVMLDNTAALPLYRSLGFREAYQYWYRVQPAAS